MIITGFNPMVVSRDSENIIRLFEELGFEKKHQPVVDAGSGEVATGMPQTSRSQQSTSNCFVQNISLMIGGVILMIMGAALFYLFRYKSNSQSFLSVSSCST